MSPLKSRKEINASGLARVVPPGWWVWPGSLFTCSDGKCAGNSPRSFGAQRL